MKVPFSYQKTEFDCGPTSLTNALSFLFDREEIPPEMIRRIMAYCLDGFDGRAIPAAAAPPQQPCALSAPGSMATGNPFISPSKPSFWKPTRSTWERTAPC